MSKDNYKENILRGYLQRLSPLQYFSYVHMALSVQLRLRWSSWQLWNLCSSEQDFCSWYNFEQVHLYWLENHNSELQHYLFGTDAQKVKIFIFSTKNYVFFFQLALLPNHLHMVQLLFFSFFSHLFHFLFRRMN